MVSKNKLKLGVIGGVGPAASAFFYNEVTDHTLAECDQDHLDIILLSHASLPDRTEAILTGEAGDLIRLLQEDVRTLTKMGVSNIAIPCNTSYYYYEQMQAVTDVPIIHMIRESVDYAVKHYADVRRIGIMATDGTLDAGLYDMWCDKLGVQAVHPSPQRQEEVMHIIYKEIKRGHHGSEALFNDVMAEFREAGCDVVILACTELSVYKRYHEVPEYCLDAMDVLIRESIVRSNAVYIPQTGK